MKVHYSSDDGKVTGYGAEGFEAVKAYEADPWSAWNFPWKWSDIALLFTNSQGRDVYNPQFRLAAGAFSKMVPIIQKSKDANPLPCPCPMHGQLEAILQETLDAGRQ